MRIALYISPHHTIPPTIQRILAPWWLVRDIADGLVDRGHDVSVYCARGSRTKARVVDLDIDALDEKQGSMSPQEYQRYIIFQEQRMVSELYFQCMQGAYDIVGNHVVDKTLAFARFTRVPTVYTLHDPLDAERLSMYACYRNVSNIHYISISNAQRDHADLSFAGTVYNGVHVKDYVYSGTEGKYLLTVGRICKEKGIADSIHTAKCVMEPLIVCGENFPQIPELDAYWENEVKPHIDDQSIQYQGLTNKEEIMKLYRGAKVLLVPIHWEEPFGLVMIEAMACGTPVVAYNRGSVPEIVRDGVTGFIVDDDDKNPTNPTNLTNPTNEKGQWIIKKRGIEGLVEAVRRIGEIDRSACRRHVEENFTVEKMVEGYEQAYKKILGGI